jgi:hypothetical protein
LANIVEREPEFMGVLFQHKSGPRMIRDSVYLTFIETKDNWALQPMHPEDLAPYVNHADRAKSEIVRGCCV